MVEPMFAEQRVVHIVGEAGQEPIAMRNWRNFDQRKLRGDNQVAQESNVQIQRRNAGVNHRLAGCEQRPNFVAKAVPNADKNRSGE